MANNQYINKVEFGGQTLIDLTDTTAGAADVRSGTYYHDKTGELVEGSLIEEAASIQDSIDVAGGTIRDIEIIAKSGGGLEYEEGSATISQRTATPYNILFSKTHNKPPAFFTISASSGGTYGSSTLLSMTYSLNEAMGCVPMDENYNSDYGTVAIIFINTSNAMTSAVYRLYYSSSSTGDNTAYPNYWATNEYIKLFASNTRYIGGTYKWIAIWLPDV